MANELALGGPKKTECGLRLVALTTMGGTMPYVARKRICLHLDPVLVYAPSCPPLVHGLQFEAHSDDESHQ
jgi:hypothetical protein